jgi:hypothetical protein
VSLADAGHLCQCLKKQLIESISSEQLMDNPNCSPFMITRAI